MSYLLIAVFWSGTTSSVFTAEFNSDNACNAAGDKYQAMVAFESQAWVGSFGRSGNFAAIPAPARASYVCASKGYREAIGR